MSKKTFQHWLESDEHEAVMIHKAKTGETLEHQVRQAIKDYVKKIEKEKKS